ncbi:hypothetical protein BC826DRAFT_988336, partial [Russula brevipes]
MMVNPAGDGGGDRNALRVPVMADGLRSWSYPLFDCFSDLPTCVLSTFCCCYVYSQNKLRFAHLQSYSVPLRERVGVYNHECIAHVLSNASTRDGRCRFVLSPFSSSLDAQVRVMDVGIFPN